MKFHFGEFIRHVFVKARKRYRFFGIVCGQFACGFLYPYDRSLDVILLKDKEPELPFDAPMGN